MRRSEPPLAPPKYFDSVVKELTASLIPRIPRGIPGRSSLVSYSHTAFPIPDTPFPTENGTRAPHSASFPVLRVP